MNTPETVFTDIKNEQPTSKEWPAQSPEMRPVAALVAYDKNSRTHSKAQILQVAASIQEWGWTTPILIDENDLILAGHARLAAAKEIGLKDVPCIVARGWTANQKRAYVIADNKLAENAGWDLAILKEELGSIDATGFDLSLTGFSENELGRLLFKEGEGLTDPDAVPEAPMVPTAQIGDIFILGNHRLICGDSTDPNAVTRLLNGVKPHLMVTDPPYGVEYDASWREKRLGQKGGAVGKVLNDNKADWREAWALFPGNVAYVWHAALSTGIVQESLLSCGFNTRSQIIWAKDNFAISRCDYHWQHEPCWYAVREKTTGNYSGDRKQSTLWEIPKPKKSETGHSTQKPIECMQRPIENNSSVGQAIYDPFSGSGTTLIAAERTNRHCYAIELNPAYVDVAVKRWQDFTGNKAIHQETGTPFNDLAQIRAQT